MASMQDLKKNAIQSAFYDTVLQIVLRIVSFILNAVIIRSVGPAVFAVCSVRLLLLYSTTLLLTREAFRRAALAARPDQIDDQFANLLWMSLAALVPVGAVLFYLWSTIMIVPPLDVLPVPWHYTAALVIILTSCAVELCAEMPFVLSELQLWTRTRVLLEGAMQLCRSVAFAVVVLLTPSYAVLGYTVAHLLGSCVYSVTYYIIWLRIFHQNDKADSSDGGKASAENFSFFAKNAQEKCSVGHLPFDSLVKFLPSSRPGQLIPRPQPALLKVTRSFFIQCWLKELLTEGEWILMNLLPLISLTQQGTYQVVSNLGSLGARLVFRSIETAAYKFFAQSLDRGKLYSQQPKQAMAAGLFLRSLYTGLSLFSCLLLSFGWSYSCTLLKLYGGWMLSSAYPLMRAQCVLLVFLAFNGVTEAFTFAVMSEQQLSVHSGLLVVFSAVYLSLAAVLSMMFGAVGFVIANCINMFFRIAHGWMLIERFYRESPLKPLRAVLLPAGVLLRFTVITVALAASEIMLYDVSILLHLAVGASLMPCLLFSLRDSCRPLYTSMLQRLDSLLFSSRWVKARATRNLSETTSESQDTVEKKYVDSVRKRTVNKFASETKELVDDYYITDDEPRSSLTVDFKTCIIAKIYSLLYKSNQFDASKCLL